MSTIPPDALTVVLGDFNLPDVNWATVMATSAEGSLFCHSLDKLQLVSEPTHIKGSVLDLVITNNPERITDLSVDSTSCLAKSDHYPASCAQQAKGTLP